MHNQLLVQPPPLQMRKMKFRDSKAVAQDEASWSPCLSPLTSRFFLLFHTGFSTSVFQPTCPFFMEGYCVCTYVMCARMCRIVLEIAILSFQFS